MRILGLDPGLAKVGYGVIEYNNNNFIQLSCGVIKTNASDDLGKRLAKIHFEVGEIVNGFVPQAVAIEQIFFAANLKTAVQVAQARGVIILATTHSGLPLYEYSPLQIKLSLTGYGRAEKQQVQNMVKKVLSIKDSKIAVDAADALAAALCHAYSLKSRKYGLPIQAKRYTRRQ
jgi:crossover junction endodeoxyribonuclease RuvC